MQPSDTHTSQEDLFRSRLDQIISMSHPLVEFAIQVNWDVLEEKFKHLYSEIHGRPGAPIRLMAGLHYLKKMYNASDESVLKSLLENPYWQYFCGFEFFVHELPLDSSTMGKWRKRVGFEGVGWLFKGAITADQYNMVLTMFEEIEDGKKTSSDENSGKWFSKILKYAGLKGKTI